MNFGLFKRPARFFILPLILLLIWPSAPVSSAENPLDGLDDDLKYLDQELSAELGESPEPPQESSEFVDAAGEETQEDAAVAESTSGDRPEGMAKETITLELKGVDVLDVLKILSKKSGLNIVAGNNVRGQVTLFLQDVDVWTALLTVLETSDLAYVDEKGIIKVMAVKDYEAAYGKAYNDRRETRSYVLKNAKAVDVSTALSQIKSPLGTVIVDERSNSVIATDFVPALVRMEETIRVVDTPSETRFFQLRYAEAEDIEGKITEILTPGTGTLKVDTRTNKVVVTDIPEKVQKIADIVHAFDSEPRQVLVEAKIVEVALNDDFVLGIDWTLVLQGSSERIATLDSRAFGGIAAPSDAPATSPLSSLSTSSDPGLSTITVNTTNNDFNTIINALEGISKVDVLSNPRIMVLDKQEARIAVATKQPFVSQTVVQATNTATTADNVEFVDVGVTLAVTPTITDTGYVMMQIKPQVSTAGTPLELQGAGQSATTSEALFTRTIVPVVTSQEAETTLLVKSGETVILGGLIQEREGETRRKVPFLGDIPVLGAAFRNGGRDFTRKELVIFISPTVVLPRTTEGAKLEYQRYMDEGGKMKPMDTFGGIPYEKGLYNSQEPFSGNMRPFWRLDRAERRHFFPSSKRMYKDQLDPYINKKYVTTPQTGQPTVPSTITLEGYRQVVKEKVESVVRTNAELAAVGDISMILTVRQDGAIEEISFANPTLQSDEKLQRKFIDAVQNTGPYPRFPSSFNQSRQSFNVSV